MPRALLSLLLAAIACSDREVSDLSKDEQSLLSVHHAKRNGEQLHTAAEDGHMQLKPSSSRISEIDASEPTAPLLFIGIKTAPKPEYRSRRELWRASQCSKNLIDAGFKYAFMVGMPIEKGHDLSGHLQGGFATPSERSEEEALLQEQGKYHDLEIVPMRDLYMDLPNKLISILDFGIWKTNAKYIMEVDDEYCVHPDKIHKLIKEFEDQHNASHLWAGDYMFQGTEYSSMLGPNNESAPYFSGHGCFLNRELAQLIIDDDRAHTVLSGIYGTVADDANLGKWVKYAQEKHGAKITFRSENLIYDVSKGPPKE